MHVLEHLAAEVRDDEAVEDREVATQFCAFHKANTKKLPAGCQRFVI